MGYSIEAKQIKVYSNSHHIVNHALGESTIREPNLMKYLVIVHSLWEKISEFHITHLLYDENGHIGSKAYLALKIASKIITVEFKDEPSYTPIPRVNKIKDKRKT